MTIYDQITATILRQIESGVPPWRQPWSGNSWIPTRENGDRYRGINVPILLGAQSAAGYESGRWLTYKQAQARGGHVRKGERATTIVYASTWTAIEQNENGEEKTRAVPFLRAYSVFNVAQCEGLPADPAADKPENVRFADGEMLIARSGATIEHGDFGACYVPRLDTIRLPRFESFRSGDDYYSTAFHELVHWTGHASRLNRLHNDARFGNEHYAREELVAELGAAFICGATGMNSSPREDHAGYLDSWCKVLRSDSRAIVHAASQAQKAADYLVA